MVVLDTSSAGGHTDAVTFPLHFRAGLEMMSINWNN